METSGLYSMYSFLLLFLVDTSIEELPPAVNKRTVVNTLHTRL